MKCPNETLRQSTPLEMSSWNLSQSAKHIRLVATHLRWARLEAVGALQSYLRCVFVGRQAYSPKNQESE